MLVPIILSVIVLNFIHAGVIMLIIIKLLIVVQGCCTTCRLCWVPNIFIIMLNVVMLSVTLSSVFAPFTFPVPNKGVTIMMKNFESYKIYR